MRPTAFRSTREFRAWLAEHHRSDSALFVRCYKTRVSQKGMTYREALDEALCFGWIDGVRHGLDDASFSVRFTPRKPRSRWSAVNLKRAAELEAKGRMQAPGLAAVRARVKSPARDAFASKPAELSPGDEARLRANARAWAFFQTQPPWYRRTTAFWVTSAKQEATRKRRLDLLIVCSERRRPIPPLARAPKHGTARPAGGGRARGSARR